MNMQLLQLTIIAVLATFINADCSNKTSVIRNQKEYRIFFHNLTFSVRKEANSFDHSKACRDWGFTWKSSYGGVAAVLHGCLSEIIESAKDKFFQDSTGFFVGPNFAEIADATSDASTGMHWYNGSRIQSSGGDQLEVLLDDMAAVASSSAEEICTSAFALVRPIGNIQLRKWIERNCKAQMYYICERDVPEQLVWGYSENKHAMVPDEWINIDDQCGGDRQSPVNVEVSPRMGKCKQDGVSNELSWETENGIPVNWVVTNTARMVEIKFEPAGILQTKFHGSNKRLKVDYIHIKWGMDHQSGSEHTIGGVRYAGELQIFHQPEDGNVHALAFMIQQRTFQPNQNWAQLLSHIIRSQEANTSSTMPSPESHILRLLRDSANIRFYSNPRYIMGSAIRYEGSLTQPPCTQNVMWTIYPRPISLSRTQFGVLRHLHMEGREGSDFRYMTQTTREIRNNVDCEFCKV